MNEYIQYVLYLLGMCTVAKLFISEFFEITDIFINKLIGSVIKIKNLKKTIHK